MNYNFLCMLDECRDKNRLINIAKSGLNEFMLCIPINIGSELLLVKYAYDFQFDGYKIILLDDIIDIRNDQTNELINDIYINEGLIKNNDSIENFNVKNLSLSNWSSVFEFLKHFDCLIIECDSNEFQGLNYGKILQIQQDKIKFLRFDRSGNEEIQPVYIKYSHIQTVTFYDRYSTIFSKYIKRKTCF